MTFNHDRDCWHHPQHEGGKISENRNCRLHVQLNVHSCSNFTSATQRSFADDCFLQFIISSWKHSFLRTLSQKGEMRWRHLIFSPAGCQPLTKRPIHRSFLRMPLNDGQRRWNLYPWTSTSICLGRLHLRRTWIWLIATRFGHQTDHWFLCPGHINTS